MNALRYVANRVRIADDQHVQRVLNMASEDGLELVTIVAAGTDAQGHAQATIVWRTMKSPPSD